MSKEYVIVVVPGAKATAPPDIGCIDKIAFELVQEPLWPTVEHMHIIWIISMQW